MIKRLADSSALTLNNLKVSTNHTRVPSCADERYFLYPFSPRIRPTIGKFSNTCSPQQTGPTLLVLIIYGYLLVPLTFLLIVCLPDILPSLTLIQFSLVYSLDDTSGDTTLSNFNINKIPSYVFSVLRDIQSTNNMIKIHLVPWSPVSCLLIHTETGPEPDFHSARLDER